MVQLFTVVVKAFSNSNAFIFSPPLAERKNVSGSTLSNDFLLH
jgi:hypothetical protein